MLSIISLNVERSKPLDRIIPFLKEQKPDVFCVQELMERDVALFAETLGSVAHVFAPMSLIISETPPNVCGTGIFSRLPIRSQEIRTYATKSETMPELDVRDSKTWNNKKFVLPVVDVETEGEIMRVASTHFRWTPDGRADDAQRSDLKELFKEFDSLGEFVVCGDFNAPRGGEIFAALTARLRDNIPPEYDWSVDIPLHRNNTALLEDIKKAGLTGLMVDGLFSTPAYTVSNVTLVNGVSDHAAIAATVEKR